MCNNLITEEMFEDSEDVQNLLPKSSSFSESEYEANNRLLDDGNTVIRKSKSKYMEREKNIINSLTRFVCFICILLEIKKK